MFSSPTTTYDKPHRSRPLVELIDDLLDAAAHDRT